MAYTPRYTKKKPKFSWIFDLATAVSLCLILVFGGLFLRDRHQSKTDQDAFQDLIAMVEAQTQPSTSPPQDPQAATPAAAPTSPYQVLSKENPDFSAWLTVPGTMIDYPVMHTPQDIEYYIYRSFDRSDSPSGTPFIGEYGDLDSSKCIIYGHNMKDGTMFHDLLKYEKKSFWQEHPTFTIHTLEGERTYAIFSAVRTRVLETGESGLRFYRLPEGLKDWLLYSALYDTGITPEDGDSIVILSTCSYHTDEGRFLVAGRLQTDADG